ncbi:MAG: LON peptidase substrate-binding domain-containing protein [Bradymonadia bacterium]
MTHPPNLQPIDTDDLHRLPIFPLPNVVLFPGAVLPLHVFEHRYRDLVKYTLAHGQVMGIPLLRPGYTPDEYEGSPPVFEFMGAGRVVAHQPMPDGRCNILIQGIERIRLLEELNTDYSFRLLRAAHVPEVGSISPAQLDTLRSLTLRLAHHLPQARDALMRLVSETHSPGLLVDQLAAYLVGDLEERQRLLETLDPGVRIERLNTQLGALYLELSEPDGGGQLN